MVENIFVCSGYSTKQSEGKDIAQKMFICSYNGESSIKVEQELSCGSRINHIRKIDDNYFVTFCESGFIQVWKREESGYKKVDEKDTEVKAENMNDILRQIGVNGFISVSHSDVDHSSLIKTFHFDKNNDKLMDTTPDVSNVDDQGFLHFGPSGDVIGIRQYENSLGTPFSDLILYNNNNKNVLNHKSYIEQEFIDRSFSLDDIYFYEQNKFRLFGFNKGIVDGVITEDGNIKAQPTLFEDDEVNFLGALEDGQWMYTEGKSLKIGPIDLSEPSHTIYTNLKRPLEHVRVLDSGHILMEAYHLKSEPGTISVIRPKKNDSQ